MRMRASARFGFPALLALALALTAAADFLLFDEPVGIGLLLFLSLLAAGIAAARGTAGALPLQPSLILLGSLLPLAENVSPLSAAVALLGSAVFALACARRLGRDPAAVAGQLAGFAASMPFRFPLDLKARRRAAARMRGARGGFARLAVWIMPLALAAAFIALFAAANPIIEHWLSLIRLEALFDLLEWRRLAFWTPVLAGTWMFLRPRLAFGARRRKGPASPTPAPVPAAVPDGLAQHLFGKAAIFRALLVFNALFAVQTVLDSAYLWGGVALPDGLTYAGYAHRGAYPLVATALLAAAFILLAMRPGSASAADRRIRALVYLWTAQNIVLVFSSILRLDLYVGIYALTYWRVAAFVWMVLVAAGLALILARIFWGKSNRWLVSANLVTLALTLYACCFVNFAGLIAGYNVDHSRETGGEGLELDVWYLLSLGPEAIPAMDRFVGLTGFATPAQKQTLLNVRPVLDAQERGRLTNWRAWTFRDWRLLRYLDGRAAVPAVPRAAPFRP